MDVCWHLYLREHSDWVDGIRERLAQDGWTTSIQRTKHGQALFQIAARNTVDDLTRTLLAQVTETEKILSQLFAGSWEMAAQMMGLGRSTDGVMCDTGRGWSVICR
jgi:hypothetical protein